MESKEVKEFYDELYYMEKMEGHTEFKMGKINDKRKWLVKGAHPKDMVIFDVGFGRGEIMKLCLEDGCKYAYGIDYSEAATTIAKVELNSYKNKKLICGDILEMDKVTKPLDRVFMIDLIEHISEDELKAFLPKLKEKMKHGCLLIASTPVDINRGQYKGMHMTQYDEKKIREIFSEYFNNVRFTLNGCNLCFSGVAK